MATAATAGQARQHDGSRGRVHGCAGRACVCVSVIAPRPGCGRRARRARRSSMTNGLAGTAPCAASRPRPSRWCSSTQRLSPACTRSPRSTEQAQRRRRGRPARPTVGAARRRARGWRARSRRRAMRVTYAVAPGASRRADPAPAAEARSRRRPAGCRPAARSCGGTRRAPRPTPSAAATRAARRVRVGCSSPASTTMRAASRVDHRGQVGGARALAACRGTRRISSALPTVRPSGASMSVMNASVRTPAWVPIATIDRASARRRPRSS